MERFFIYLMAHVFLMVPTAAALYAADVTDAPVGYSWKHVDDIKAAFLLPDAWSYHKEYNGTTVAVFLSKQNIAENGKFDTGVSINVIRANPSAPRQLKEIIEMRANKFGSKISMAQMEPFVRLNTQYDSVRDDGVNIRIVHIVLVNVYTKTSYMIIFETPASLWDKNWKIGEVVVNNLALETNI